MKLSYCIMMFLLGACLCGQAVLTAQEHTVVAVPPSASAARCYAACGLALHAGLMGQVTAASVLLEGGLRWQTVAAVRNRQAFDVLLAGVLLFRFTLELPQGLLRIKVGDPVLGYVSAGLAVSAADGSSGGAEAALPGLTITPSVGMEAVLLRFSGQGGIVSSLLTLDWIVKPEATGNLTSIGFVQGIQTGILLRLSPH